MDPLRVLLFDPQQCVIRHSSPYDSAPGVSRSYHWGQPYTTQPQSYVAAVIS